ncbi:MAG: serine O-acetyltransferase [Clostridia bacterium]|nr:serine O-acetyltransferase [Clostridia bacterium]
MFETLKEDIQCVLDRDPAAKSALEVYFCYPGFHAVRAYRRAHKWYLKGHTTIARMISDRCRRKTGVDIHPGATIGRRLFIDHACGVVIGETCVIGDDCTIYQGATLGGTGKITGKRHPTIGNNVTISAGSAVLGPFTVGDHAKIGAGAVVLSEVPPYATVVGVPGRVVRMRRCPMGICNAEDCPGKPAECPHAKACPHRSTCCMMTCGEDGVDLDQVHLPDPVAQQFSAMEERLKALEARLEAAGIPAND